MKQLIFESERKLAIREGLTPKAGPNQALLRTLVTGISAGTEGMWWNGTATALRTGRKTYPYFPGYELVGEVVEVGEGFQGLALGDRVFAMKPHADHALLTSNDIWFRLPVDFPLERALGIALTGTSLHAIHRSGITVGDSCAVVGLGILGLCMLQTLAQGMSAPVIAVTSDPRKRELARTLGACETLGHGDALPAPWLNGVSTTFDCSGVNSGVATAVKLAADQGTVVAAGFYTEPMELDGEAMFSKELTIRSVRATGTAGAATPFNPWTREATMRLAAEMVFKGSVQNDALITHRIQMKDARDAYQMIVDKTEPYLQVVMNWNIG